MLKGQGNCTAIEPANIHAHRQTNRHPHTDARARAHRERERERERETIVAAYQTLESSGSLDGNIRYNLLPL